MANVQSIVYNQARDGKLSLNQLYILNDGSYIKLSDLRYATKKIRDGLRGKPLTKRDMLEISSLEEFNRLRADSTVTFYIPPEYSSSKRLSLSSATNMYPESRVGVVVKNTSTDITPIGSDGEDFWTQIKGNKRTFTFKHEAWNNEDAFVLVKLNGESRYRIVKKSKLEVYIDGYAEPKSLVDVTDLTAIDKKPINYTVNGQAVDTICTDCQFTIDKLLSYNKIDLATASEVTMTLGEDEKYVQTDSTKIPRYFSVQIPVTVEEANPERARIAKDGEGQETHSVHKIKCVNYEISNEGQYLLVTPKHSKTEIMVSVEDLFLDKDCKYSAKELKPEQMVSEKLFAKVKGVESGIELNALSMRQALIRYSSIKSLQLTENVEDILGGNSYLTLEDGTPVLETQLAKPIAYDVVEDQKSNDYDALYCIGDDGKSYIVPKGTFDGGISIKKHTVDGKVVNLKQEKTCRIKRVSNYREAQIVQNTSLYGSDVNNCKVIGGTVDTKTGKFVKDVSKTEENLNEERAAVYAEFARAYRQGQYRLDKVFVNGEFKKLSDSGKRYVLTDEVMMNDYAHEWFVEFENRDLQFSEKNGKIEPYGGPKFSFKKSMKKYFSNMFKVAGVSGIAVAGVLGPVGLVMFVAGLGVGVAASPIAAAVNGFRSHVHNHSNHLWEHKNKVNQPEWASEVNEELENILKAAEKRNLSKEAVLAMFQSVKTKIAAQGISRFETSFEIKDGVAIINENNVALAHEHVEKLLPKIKRRDELQKEIDKMKKKGKDVSSLLQEYNKIVGEIELALSRQENGIVYPMTSNCEKLNKKATNLQTYILIKYCGIKSDELGLITGFDLTKLTYSLESDTFSYDGKVLDKENGSDIEKEIAKIIEGTKSNSLGNSEEIAERERAEIAERERAEHAEREAARITGEEHVAEAAPETSAIELPESWDGKLKMQNVRELLKISEAYLTNPAATNAEEVKSFIETNIHLFKEALEKGWKGINTKDIITVNNQLLDNGIRTERLFDASNEIILPTEKFNFNKTNMSVLLGIAERYINNRNSISNAEEVVAFLNEHIGWFEKSLNRNWASDNIEVIVNTNNQLIQIAGIWGSRLSTDPNEIILKNNELEFSKDNVRYILEITKKYINKSTVTNNEEVRTFIQKYISFFERTIRERETLGFDEEILKEIADINNKLIEDKGFKANKITYTIEVKETLAITET